MYLEIGKEEDRFEIVIGMGCFVFGIGKEYFVFESVLGYFETENLINYFAFGNGEKFLVNDPVEDGQEFEICLVLELGRLDVVSWEGPGWMAGQGLCLAASVVV